MHESLIRRLTANSRGMFESAREADLHLTFGKLKSEFSGRARSTGISAGDQCTGKDLLHSMAKTSVPELCTFLERHFSTEVDKSVTQRDFLLTDARVLNALANFIEEDPTAPQAKRLSRQIESAVSESFLLRGLYHTELKRVTNVELLAMSRLKKLALGTLAAKQDSSNSLLAQLKCLGLRFLKAA